MTNHEWFCSLPPDIMAHVITEFCPYERTIYTLKTDGESYEDKIKEWLMKEREKMTNFERIRIMTNG